MNRTTVKRHPRENGDPEQGWIPDQVGNDGGVVGNDKATVGNDKILNELEKEFEEEKKSYHKHMQNHKFSYAFDLAYEFLWHRFADYYIEALKEELANGNIKANELLFKVYIENLKFLHPFTPFVTEAVWREFNGVNKSILNDSYIK